MLVFWSISSGEQHTKRLQKWTTRSGSILTFKKDGRQCKMNADFFKYKIYIFFVY